MPEELISDVHAGIAILALEGYLGAAWIKDAVTTWQRRRDSKRWVEPLRPHDNLIAHLFGRLRVDFKDRDVPSDDDKRDLDRLASIAVNVIHVASRLTPKDSTRLASLLRSKTYVDGYLYQCAVAAHHVRDGYEIKSFSLGETVDGDLIVGGASCDVEIQCKALDLGSGRRIPPRVFAKFAQPIMAAIDRKDWRGVIRVSCASRLDDRDVLPLTRAVLARLDADSDATRVPSGFRVAVEPRRAGVIPFDEVHAATERAPARPLVQAIVALTGRRGEPGVRSLIVAASDKDDKVIGKMLHEAVTAAKQLRGDLPGIVVVHTPETVNWAEVSQAKVLDAHVSAVIETGALKKASAVVFTSEKHDNGSAYVFENLTANVSLPNGFRVFGAKRPTQD